MTPKDFRNAAIVLYGRGHRGVQYRKMLAADLSLSVAAVKKYWYGERTIPDRVEKHIDLLIPERNPFVGTKAYRTLPDHTEEEPAPSDNPFLALRARFSR